MISADKTVTGMHKETERSGTRLRFIELTKHIGKERYHTTSLPSQGALYIARRARFFSIAESVCIVFLCVLVVRECAVPPRAMKATVTKFRMTDIHLRSSRHTAHFGDVIL